MTTNTTIEEGVCSIVIFFLLLPVMICIIKDVRRDFLRYYFIRSPHMKSKTSTYELNARDDGTSMDMDYESESLLKSKDSDEDNPNDDDDDTLDLVDVDRTFEAFRSSPNVSVTLVDKNSGNVLAKTKNTIHNVDGDTDEQALCANSKIPELILSPIIPEYHSHIAIKIKPMELCVWLLFLTISYLALRTMVVSKNMRHNFKYTAVEMQDIFELGLRGIVLYVIGNIGERVSVKFFLWIAWFVFFYPFVFQICPTTFTIDSESKFDWTLISISVFVGASNFYIVLDNFKYVWRIQKWWIYGYFAFFCVVLYHIALIRSANHDIAIHVHHHHWAFVLSLFIHSPKDSSLVLHALLVAVFIHGIAVFGCENLFDYKNLENATVLDV